MITDNLSHIVITHDGGVLTSYFDHHPQFSEVCADGLVRVYRVENESLQTIPYTLRVHPDSADFLSALRTNSSSGYDWYMNEVLEKYYGFNASEREALMTGECGPYFVESEFDPLLQSQMVRAWSYSLDSNRATAPTPMCG